MRRQVLFGSGASHGVVIGRGILGGCFVFLRNGDCFWRIAFDAAYIRNFVFDVYGISLWLDGDVDRIAGDDLYIDRIPGFLGETAGTSKKNDAK